MSKMRLPRCANPAEREMLLVVFPVPPFCDAMDTIIMVNQLKAINGVFQRIKTIILTRNPVNQLFLLPIAQGSHTCVQVLQRGKNAKLISLAFHVWRGIY